MAILKAPPNMHAVSSGGHTFIATNGLIDTGEAPLSLVEEIRRHAGLRDATEDEVIAAGSGAAESDERAAVKAQLAAAGINFDGRMGTAFLQQLLKRESAQIAARKAAEAASEKESAEKSTEPEKA